MSLSNATQLTARSKPYRFSTGASATPEKGDEERERERRGENMGSNCTHKTIFLFIMKTKQMPQDQGP